MLLVCTRSEEAAPKRNEAVYAALIASDTDGISSGLVKCTLLERRKCLGHLMYDTVENMADSESLSAKKKSTGSAKAALPAPKGSNLSGTVKEG